MSDHDAPLAAAPVFDRRPDFLNLLPPQPSPIQRGTLMHLFLQRLDLHAPLDPAGLRLQLQNLIDQGLIPPDQAAALNLGQAARFFTSDLGRQLLAALPSLQREWPFTLALKAAEVYPLANLQPPQADEPVLLRGIIDCLFASPAGLVILDYKTDEISPAQLDQRAELYTAQLLLYRRAVESILHQPLAAAHLFFLHPSLARQIF